MFATSTFTDLIMIIDGKKEAEVLSHKIKNEIISLKEKPTKFRAYP